ncbi:MAG: FAD-dependent oxidoreductase [Bacteroidota bacterium]
MTKKKVVVLGGGVAGMSAAHELIERGFDVTVYERQPVYVGGKARSVDVPDSGTDGRPDWPGEHGFRFFPGFYRHVTDTMKRIPFGNNRLGVYDNLVPTSRVMMARKGKPPITTLVNYPKSLKDLKVLLNGLFNADTGLTKDDVEFFAGKLWQLMTSSYKRRAEVYERIGWWQFLDASNRSTTFQEYFVGGITRTLVAAKPRLVSTKTGGDILLQLIFLMTNKNAETDRVLNAPTNDAWLFPWRDYLKEMGVNYVHDAHVDFIHVDDTTRDITGVDVTLDFSDPEKSTQIHVNDADYYISAVPVERFADLLQKHGDDPKTNKMYQADQTLEYIPTLANSVNWMNGAQYYLNKDVTITNGHIMFIDSPWAITAISQIQFWQDGKFPITEKGNGKAKGVLSVDISDWFTPNSAGQQASELSKSEILDGVWDQMEKRLVDENGNKLIEKSMVEGRYLDRDIEEKDGRLVNVRTGEEVEDPVTLQFGPQSMKTRNQEPLLVNTTNSWSLRPEAFTQINNLFLASDYVRTNTDLATMEGANEAARRAVNSILQVSGSSQPKCKIWRLYEPDMLVIYRLVDRLRFKKGMPWREGLPWYWTLVNIIWVPITFLLNRLFPNKRVRLERIFRNVR